MKHLGVIGVVALCLLPSLAHAKAKKCSDFATQQQAQAYYESLKKAGKTGWKSLDRDGDGRACDCLPGGSSKNCPKKG